DRISSVRHVRAPPLACADKSHPKYDPPTTSKGDSGRLARWPRFQVGRARVRIRDLNWMQLEDYLGRDDRIVLPLGSTEQHAYLSLETDNILAERVSVEAARSARGSCPAGAPVRADADVR